ncbi:MAG: hypothetical protein ACRDB9_06505 [Cetobacterium sp.]
MSKMKKIGIGVVVVLGLAVVGSFMPDTEETPAPVEKEVVAEKEPTLTKEELIEKLEMYETMYDNHIAGLTKVSEAGDTIEMQKSFAQSREISSSTFSALYDLSKEYKTDSNEYKAINEMQTVYSSLEDACKNGIKYLDKNEFKYLEKYEENIKQTQIFMERYKEVKSNI